MPCKSGQLNFYFVPASGEVLSLLAGNVLNVGEFYEEVYREILQIREKAMAMGTEELIRRAEESGI